MWIQLLHDGKSSQLWSSGQHGRQGRQFTEDFKDHMQPTGHDSVFDMVIKYRNCLQCEHIKTFCIMDEIKIFSYMMVTLEILLID